MSYLLTTTVQIQHPTCPNKITNQKFNNDYIISKIYEIGSYHSSALHWNVKETKDCLPTLIQKVQFYYLNISKQLGVTFHNEAGIKKFQVQFQSGVKTFMQTSREKAKKTQYREQITVQPKEILTTATKSAITIKNYLGGLYYLTTDEIKIQDNTLYLIESKHTNNAKLPSIGDIKDGLLKMILYCNLTNVKIENQSFTSIPTLKLTSSKLFGSLRTRDSDKNKQDFIIQNGFKPQTIALINTLFLEGEINKFEIIIQGV